MIDCPLALFGISLQGREMSWNLLASEHQSEISIDIKYVAKATICTPHNNGEIRGIWNQSTTSVNLNFKCFHSCDILKVRQFQSNLTETNAHSQLPSQALNLRCFKTALNCSKCTFLVISYLRWCTDMFIYNYRELKTVISGQFCNVLNLNLFGPGAQCWSILWVIFQSCHWGLWGWGEVFWRGHFVCWMRRRFWAAGSIATIAGECLSGDS